MAGVLCKTLGVVLIGTGGRPNLPRMVDHPTTGDRCHYRAGDRSRCVEVLGLLEEVRAHQIDTLGGAAPPADTAGGSSGFDVYLDPTANGGAWVTSTYRDHDPDDGRRATISWMVLDPDLPTDELPAYLAHEFHHAIQFATDAAEPSLAVWEGAATWAEEDTFPGAGSQDLVVPDFQATPWMSLLGDGTRLWQRHGIWSDYEYGAVWMWDWLKREHGLTPIDAWNRMTQESWTNEPDLLDLLAELDGSWEHGILALTADRGRDTTHPPLLDLHLDPWTSVGTPSEAPYDLGTVFVRIHDEGPGRVHVAGGERWGLAWVETDTLVVGDTLTVTAPATIAVVALGPDGFDADDAPEQRDLTVSWTRQGDPPTSEPEAPPVESEPEDRPRGCATAPAAGWLGLWVLWATRRRISGPRPRTTRTPP